MPKVSPNTPPGISSRTDLSAASSSCTRTSGSSRRSRWFSEIESPKRILGQLHGHAIRFWSGKARSDLIVGEGLENTLSVGTALPEFDLASCLTATHLGLFIPPPWIKRIWIARDNDEAGRNASMRMRNQLESLGIACGDLVPKMGDFNDDLQAFGKDALRRSLLESMKAQGLEIGDG